MAEKGKYARLFDELKAGHITRREFMQRAAAIGVAAPIAQFALLSLQAGAAPRGKQIGWGVPAQAGAGRPTAGTEGKTRGQDGELRLIQWQSVTQLSPHVSSGTKDYLGAQLVMEPLMNYLPDGSLLPNLVNEIPTVDNGLLDPGLTVATFNLLQGVLWSDGQPFTADDVVFTWQWVSNPDNAATSTATWSVISNVEALDEYTVRVTYAGATPAWYEPLTGHTWGCIYPRHILETNDPAGAHAEFLKKPIGTGPYVVDSFTAGDQVIYTINQNYRDPNKPYFERVNLKGGGDAVSAARAVMQTGDYDHAWNLQVEPQVLAQLEEGGRGRLVVAPGNSVERIHINFSDPNTEFEGQRSHKDVPHPFFSDLAVRQAVALAADRQAIAEQFYNIEAEPPASNILTGSPTGELGLESPNTAWEFNPEKGAQLLEQAGWVLDGDVRKKDGRELSITYSTSINAARQKTQAVVKDALEQMGFKVQLQQVDSGIFFDASPGNNQNFRHFYTDIQMYTNNPTSTYPISYMIGWYSGPDGRGIAQASNGWSGQNNTRYSNPEYDALLDQARTEVDIEVANQLFIQMNDILINDAVLMPLVNRAADKYAMASNLFHGDEDNVAVGSFSNNYWNIQNWSRSAEE